MESYFSIPGVGLVTYDAITSGDQPILKTVVGATAEWTDPETGNFGAVKLGEAYTWQGLSCRRLHHAIKITGSRDPVSIVVDRCKTAKGEWKIRY